MSKVAIQLPVDIDKIINQLKTEDRIRLIRKLEEQTLSKRIDNLLERIDKRGRKNPLSEKEITEIVKEVRKELYG